MKNKKLITAYFTLLLLSGQMAMAKDVANTTTNSEPATSSTSSSGTSNSSSSEKTSSSSEKTSSSTSKSTSSSSKKETSTSKTSTSSTKAKEEEKGTDAVNVGKEEAPDYTKPSGYVEPPVIDENQTDDVFQSTLYTTLEEYYKKTYQEIQVRKLDADEAIKAEKGVFAEFETFFNGKKENLNQKLAPYKYLLDAISKEEQKLLELQKSFYAQLVLNKELFSSDVLFLLHSKDDVKKRKAEQMMKDELDKYLLSNPITLTSSQVRIDLEVAREKIDELSKRYEKETAPFNPEKRGMALLREELLSRRKRVSDKEADRNRINQDEDALLRKVVASKSIKGEFQWPLKTLDLVSNYGYRPEEPIEGVGTFHNGVDLVTPTGTPVYAAMAGVVYTASRNNISGNYIILRHANGYYSYYAHLSVLHVKQGQVVDIGQEIAKSGSTGASTGPHLHFGLAKGVWVDFVNPIDVMPKENDKTQNEKLQQAEKKVTKEQLEQARRDMSILTSEEVPDGYRLAVEAPR
ncbi:Murein DD-endopeptidase MepM and murein hydrolase activator NlpD, contain LysM domain [Pilibacter termitis]|uniref:Murein DD-endopeptidase MepM and murein hydrolase activator NlpD, contain LysM domain n=1 Tax=Pilibacter termitis TaxID=263852 RepID=A0A1T4KRR3_9ENTE|nr:M23 family metallopeptidase [Pilibacter termitis]SJZ45050.1 Murein DD-endopeptidase MepM and murein hydrolase activator NlpD, contain LysM domain [Pilibacter termitis]